MSATRTEMETPTVQRGDSPHNGSSTEQSSGNLPPAGWGVSRKKWLLPAVLIACACLLVVGVGSLVRDVGGQSDTFVYYTAKRGSLPISVTERGNLESQVTVEVICEVENVGDRMGASGTQILYIVPNGASVKEGDLLVELDSAPLQERLDTQFLSLERAEAEKIQAEVRFENQLTQNTTALEEAKLNEELAEMDVEMYEDEEGGTFQIEMQDIVMDIQEAQADMLIKDTDLTAVSELYELGYKSKGDLAAAKLAKLRSDSNLASQRARQKQLQKYTYTREKKVRNATLETAERAVTQVKRDNESSEAQALSAKNSAVRAWEKEKERYERYEEQLEKCKIYAPQEGMVAYAMGDSRRGGGSTIEEGAFVRQRQQILTLPSLNKMQVKTAVHESVLDQVRVGLPVTIRVDAFPDRSYTGSVESVAVLPDQGGWLSSDTKVYKTTITINEEVKQLKPGMTAVVEIDIETLRDIVSIPVQAIIQRGRENWCYVDQGGRPTKRVVVLGKTNDKFVEIKQGLEEGERVILNPTSIVNEAGIDDVKQEDASLDPEAGVEQGQDGKPAGAAEERQKEKAKRPSGAGGMLKQLDKDGDGKLTKEEASQMPEQVFDKMDLNQDGAIDAGEMAKLGGGEGAQLESVGHLGWGPAAVRRGPAAVRRGPAAVPEVRRRCAEVRR